MRIVDQSVELLDITPDSAKLIERAGRVCYKSEDKITDDSAAKFVQMVSKRGHLSVIEHAHATFRIITDRGITHEIVRHRLASYCLSGDTEVIGYSAKKSRSPKRWTIEQLFEWSQDPRRKGRLKLIQLRSMDNHGVIVPGKIRKILDSGTATTFKITMKSGRSIRATVGHRFMTPNGWMRLANLLPGDRIIANGLPGYANKEWIEQKYIHERLSRLEVADLLGISDSALGKAFHIGQAVLTVFSDEIISIDRFGEERTFDIEMIGPNHNFVANGLVVHNSQESTRYCNYGKDKFGKEITVIVPYGICEDNPDGSWEVWRTAMEHAEQAYFNLLDLGCKPQIARSVLPTCLKTEIVMTANFREWCHFLTLRLAPAAHPQIRIIASLIWKKLVKHCPPVFQVFDEAVEVVEVVVGHRSRQLD